MFLIQRGLRTASRTVKIAYLCTATEAQPRLQDIFRTSETDPGKHTMNHEGQFYSIDTDTMGSLFKFAGFNKEFLSQSEAFNEHCVMIRRPALENIHYLKTADYSLPPIRYVLYSPYIGAGMTMALAHILHYAWLRKWVIVHVPNAVEFTTSKKENLMQSSFDPSRKDNNYLAAAWLKHFQAQNEHLLPQIKLSKTYTWSKRESSQLGDPLSTVVQHGLTRMTHACDCVAVILKEVKSQSGPNSFRTLVAIDGLNAFFRPCNYRTATGSLEMDDLTLIKFFKELLTNDWSNAAVVVSTDMDAHTVEPYTGINKPEKVMWPDKNPGLIAKRDPWAPLKNEPERIHKGKYRRLFNMQVTHTRFLPHTPWELLGKEGVELLDPFLPIEVSKYGSKELNSCLDYYIDRNYIQNEKGRSEEGRTELIFLSGGIPRDLSRFCAPV